MKKVLFFCDKCKDLIATQRKAYKFEEEQWLYPVGEHEWCKDCLSKLDKGLFDMPDVNDTTYEHGNLENETNNRVINLVLRI